ncbi:MULTISPECIES: nitroreductase family protein [Acinetobacter]|uniref:Nitroreductase family protein n=1 Tax=Acinetobacter pecorum TaxID=2762215 RepID=A0ABR8VVA1_9GAMM|nr:nitroreductase family protein [Acinetobacter pecorum]MBD8008693.1 nitroreductase family protein [Acinetobacter pecorum]
MALLDKIGQVLTSDITKDFKFSKKNKLNDDLELTFIDQLKKRRSIYALGKRVHYSQAYLCEIIQEAVRSCPSAYDSQSTRIAVLFADSHHQFWEIVKQVQRQHVPEHIYEGVELKLNQCAEAYGTILFYEDQSVIQQLQKKMPLNSEDFSAWSEQTSGMAQFAVWATLADSGLGASLQHYNPLIDEKVAEHFDIDKNWLLRAQLCFGSIEQTVEEKLQQLDQYRFKILN